MIRVAIGLREPGKDQIEALKATAKSIREGYGAGTNIKVGAEKFHDDSDWVGHWTSKPESWEGHFPIDILIEANEDLDDYQMAALVESKIKDYQ